MPIFTGKLGAWNEQQRLNLRVGDHRFEVRGALTAAIQLRTIPGDIITVETDNVSGRVVGAAITLGSLSEVAGATDDMNQRVDALQERVDALHAGLAEYINHMDSLAEAVIRLVCDRMGIPIAPFNDEPGAETAMPPSLPDEEPFFVPLFTSNGTPVVPVFGFSKEETDGTTLPD